MQLRTILFEVMSLFNTREKSLNKFGCPLMHTTFDIYFGQILVFARISRVHILI